MGPQIVVSTGSLRGTSCPLAQPRRSGRATQPGARLPEPPPCHTPDRCALRLGRREFRVSGKTGTRADLPPRNSGTMRIVTQPKHRSVRRARCHPVCSDSLQRDRFLPSPCGLLSLSPGTRGRLCALRSPLPGRLRRDHGPRPRGGNTCFPGHRSPRCSWAAPTRRKLDSQRTLAPRLRRPASRPVGTRAGSASARPALVWSRVVRVPGGHRIHGEGRDGGRRSRGGGLAGPVRPR